MCYLFSTQKSPEIGIHLLIFMEKATRPQAHEARFPGRPGLTFNPADSRTHTAQRPTPLPYTPGWLCIRTWAGSPRGLWAAGIC